MPIHDLPDERVDKLVDRALSMKINTQSILNFIYEEVDITKKLIIKIIFEKYNDKIRRHYSGDDCLDENELIMAQSRKEAAEEGVQALQRGYEGYEIILASMRENIEGQILSMIQVQTLYTDESQEGERMMVLKKIVDIALKQAIVLLGYEEDKESLKKQAENIIYDRLGIFYS